jgi:hypothetical protein
MRLGPYQYYVITCGTRKAAVIIIDVHDGENWASSLVPTVINVGPEPKINAHYVELLRLFMFESLGISGSGSCFVSLIMTMSAVGIHRDRDLSPKSTIRLHRLPKNIPTGLIINLRSSDQGKKVIEAMPWSLELLAEIRSEWISIPDFLLVGS